MYIYKNPQWEIPNGQELLTYVEEKHPKQKLITYGCFLDHNKIDELIDTYLVSKPSEGAIEYWYEVYDVAIVTNRFVLQSLSEQQIALFEEEVKKLRGHHIAAEYRVRGHFEVSVYGELYSTRVYQLLDGPSIYAKPMKGRYLFVIDEEQEANAKIRYKIKNAPTSKQTLTLPMTLPYESREIYIRDWIKYLIAL